VALFRTVERAEQLPPEGSTREGLALDVKAKAGTDAFEIRIWPLLRTRQAA
jgi:hypothetical protein